MSHDHQVENNGYNERELENVRARIYKKLEIIAASPFGVISPAKNTTFKFRVELRDPNMQPIACKPRQLPHHIAPLVKELLNEQLEAGIIKRSRSEWCFPFNAVIKENTKLRPTVDFSPLNPHIKGDPYPTPNIQKTNMKLAAARFYSKWDFTKAYHQYPADEETAHLLTFICEFGKFQYNVMPMGIKTAPSAFQRFMDETFADLIDRVYTKMIFARTHGASKSMKRYAMKSTNVSEDII
jgi:hypothetical protein